MISILIDGLGPLQMKLVKAAGIMPVELTKVVRDSADELRLEVRKHARGRPGPRILTSRYTHSITTYQRGPFEAGAETDTLYAPRLEFGFVGVDSLGRLYNQRPYPSWRPAIGIVTPKFMLACKVVVTQALA